MDDLHSPRRPELAQIRVMACESELQRLAQRFPHLAPSDILEAIKAHGPLRRDVEAALERMSERAAAGAPRKTRDP